MRSLFVFPSAPSLRSTDSASNPSELFAGFAATVEGSDFSGSCVIGYGSSPSRCGPPHHASDRAGDLPVPVQGASVHARVSDHAGSVGRSRWRARPSCLPRHLQRRHPEEKHFRGSMAGLYVPLPTLRRHPRGYLRTARGQCGSLLLHCDGLAPSTPCRSPGAQLADSQEIAVPCIPLISPSLAVGLAVDAQPSVHARASAH